MLHIAARLALRTFVNRPASSVVAVLMLGLGIGATTAVFSVVNAVLLRPLPFPDSDRLVWVWSFDSRRGLQQWVSYPDLLDWRRQADSFAQLAGTGAGSELVLTGNGEPQRFESLIVTTNFFPMLGAPPLLGTTVSSEAGGGEESVVVLSYGCWQRAFGGDPAVVGRSITLSGRGYTVIGVMPPEFRFPIQSSPVDLWVLMRDDQFNPVLRSRREARLMEVIGRLEPGVTIRQAQSEMDVLAANLSREYPETNEGMGVRVVPAIEQVTGSVAQLLSIVLAAVGCVLLIACVNVANLLLARAAARQEEIATRAALGASRLRLAVELLIESAPLSVAGSVVGVLLAMWGVGAIVPLLPADVPRAGEIDIDATVLGFTIAVSAATALIFGLAPAWATTRPNPGAILQAGSSRAAGRVPKRLSSALVVVEIALAMLLLAGAGLCLNSFWRLSRPDPGFDPRNVLTFRMGWPTAEYTRGQAAEAFGRLQARLQAIPGVESASVGLQLPDRGRPVLDDVLPYVEVEGREIAPGDRLRASMMVVQPGYFATMRIPILRGRAFNPRDRARAGLVTIVNESLVRAYFPNEDPIGKRLAMDSWALGGERTREIVAVVADVKHQGLDGAAVPVVYLPLAQYPVSESYVVVRTAGDPLQFVGPVRAAVRSIDPDQPIYDAQTLEARVAASLVTDRFGAVLLAAFALLAAALAAGGLYALLSCVVAQRTRELGIRITLGARPVEVMVLVMRQGLAMAVAGAALGLIGAFALTRVIRALLFGVSAVDPATFAVAILLLFAIAGIACMIPARRATRVSPVVALRQP